MGVCVSCERWEWERRVLRAAYSLFIPAAQASVWQRSLQQLHWHAQPIPPPTPPPPPASPYLPHPSWCLCCRTPTARWKLRLKGHFNFSDRARTVVPVSLLLTPSPSPLSSPVMQSLLCPPSSFADTLIVFLLSFLLHPGSLCSFAEQRTAVWPIHIDPLNRPRNSSLHQAALCWPRQHSTYKVDGLLCHTPHYCKWVH